MKPSVKRLFARSMTGGLDLVEPPATPSLRSSARRAMLITLAGLLAIVGALAGGYYFAMRPVSLRIAVGPANSDDVKLVQTLTQAFTQSHGYVRLRPVQTDGAAASAKDLAEGKVDLAIIRGDLECRKMPRRWRRCARMSRCCGCRPPRAKERSRVRRSSRFRSLPDAASALSAAP